MLLYINRSCPNINGYWFEFEKNNFLVELSELVEISRLYVSLHHKVSIAYSYISEQVRGRKFG